MNATPLKSMADNESTEALRDLLIFIKLPVSAVTFVIFTFRILKVVESISNNDDSLFSISALEMLLFDQVVAELRLNKIDTVIFVKLLFTIVSVETRLISNR